MRWSTHTLSADLNDTVRSRADSTTSTYVDTFAHRRKSRISDLTCVDHLNDDLTTTHLTSSGSLASSINDLSLTLNNDDDDASHLLDLPDVKSASSHVCDNCNVDDRERGLDMHERDDDDDDHEEDDNLAQRIDRLMAATMEALEASNRLVLDTLSSRAKLAQLNAMEAALDSHLDAREANLHRQIQAVTDMTDFISKSSVELQKLISPAISGRIPSGASSTSQLTTLADPAELEVRGAAATGIVQALDRDATIGKTAAKRLERMLQTPSPNASPSSAASAQRRNSNATRRAFSISNFGAVQSSIAEEGQHGQDEMPSTPELGSAQDQSNESVSPSATVSNTAAPTPDSRTSTPQKKRSVSYDSRAPGAMKLMTKLAGPSRATSSGFVPSASELTAPALAAGPATVTASIVVADSSLEATQSKLISKAASSRGSSKPTIRPSLMATLRQDPALATSQSSFTSNAAGNPASTTRSLLGGISGLPSYSRSVSLKASADVAAPSTAAESTLAALFGMPSAASVSSRTETPSESSYFDSAMEDSISSASPPTPGSIHAIHGLLATPWKPTERDRMHNGADIPSSQERSARRSSMQYSTLVSPRASLSLSDRDRAQQLSSQLAELRAERVTWNPQSVGSAELGSASQSTAGSSASGGGALRALQKLNEMSAAKLVGQSGTGVEPSTSKRTSLGLGLPRISALRPSASRSTSTTAPLPSSSPSNARPATASAVEDETAVQNSTSIYSKPAVSVPKRDSLVNDADAADTSSSSLLGGGWRAWASWNAAPAVDPSGETSIPQR